MMSWERKCENGEKPEKREKIGENSPTVKCTPGASYEKGTSTLKVGHSETSEIVQSYPDTLASNGSFPTSHSCSASCGHARPHRVCLRVALGQSYASISASSVDNTNTQRPLQAFSSSWAPGVLISASSALHRAGYATMRCTVGAPEKSSHRCACARENAFR